MKGSTFLFILTLVAVFVQLFSDNPLIAAQAALYWAIFLAAGVVCQAIEDKRRF